jgi:outer membrane immunogenic protein
MRIQTAVGISAIAGLAMSMAGAPAHAADIPGAAPMVRAPVTAPPPRLNWYGSYIGIQGGYAWSSEAMRFTPGPDYAADFAAGDVPNPAAGDPRGYLAGITYGTNWQFGSVVLGMESDFSFTDIKKRETLGPLTGATVSVTAEQKMKYFSTTRLRAGFLMGDSVLLYGTGGLANASVEGSASFNFSAPGACAGGGDCPAGDKDKSLWGWAAGGGLEFANGPWSVKVEYLHYDLGDLKFTATDPTLPGSAITARTKFAGDIVRGGINYRFNWTFWDLFFGGR